jgi:hypothetical protein
MQAAQKAQPGGPLTLQYRTWAERHGSLDPWSILGPARPGAVVGFRITPRPLQTFEYLSAANMFADAFVRFRRG